MTTMMMAWIVAVGPPLEDCNDAGGEKHSSLFCCKVVLSRLLSFPIFMYLLKSSSRTKDTPNLLLHQNLTLD